MRKLLLIVWAILFCCAMAPAQAEALPSSPVTILSASDNEEHKIALVTITNVHQPEQTKYTVYKVWQDDDNLSGMRGPYGVQLYANGTPVGTPVTLDADTLSYTWKNLYRYERGEEIRYTVDEVQVPEGYRAEVQGNTLINRYVPSMWNGLVHKYWHDDNDRDGLRPQSVTLHLYAEGILVLTLELTEDEDWSSTFGRLPVYVRDAARMGWPIPADEDNPERKIAYTLKEETVPGYTCEYSVTDNGFSVTNTHEPESIDIPVRKIWEDTGNKYEYRPESITMRLMADGVVVETMVLTENVKWRGTFQNHPVNAEGEPIKYTVIEDEIERYTTRITGSATAGFTITNELIYGYDFRFTKVWQDTAQEHPTPQFILYNPDGTVHRTPDQPPSDRGNGNYVYSLVDEDDYYVVELPMEGYETEYINQDEYAGITDCVFTGGTIINTAILVPPDTGDMMNPAVYLLLLTASAAVLILLQKRRR